MIQTNTDTEPGRMSLWCSAMVWLFTYSTLFNQDLYSYLALHRHTHTNPPPHTQTNTCVNRCFTAIELVQFQKVIFENPLTNINI